MPASTLDTTATAVKRDELRRAEEFLLGVLAPSAAPLRLRDVLDQRAEAGAADLSPAIIRRALWHLADMGRVDFTPDWRVRKAG